MYIASKKAVVVIDGLLQAGRFLTDDGRHAIELIYVDGQRLTLGFKKKKARNVMFKTIATALTHG